MASRPIQITESRVIVVEGKDDAIILEELMKSQDISGIQVIPSGGKDNITNFIEALLKMPEFRDTVTFLGIMQDNDTNPEREFKRINRALQHHDLPIPSNPLEVAGEELKVCICMLPNSGTPGMLEDICLQSVGDDPAISCVDEYFDCLEKKGIDTSHARSKKKVQVYLASKNEPWRGLGNAAKDGDWNWTSEAFDIMKQMLETSIEN